MAKLAFRTGAFAYKERMIKDQTLVGALFWYSYPEAYLTDAETAEKARSLVAKAVEGSDVDIVSNSEIVLNEVRIAVKKGRLSPEDVRIVWYKEGEPGHETRVEVGLTLSGRFASLPTGFFDTLDNQLARLI